MARQNVSCTVANPTIRFATLTIDDTDYQLAYSFNAIATAEHIAGCNLLSGLENLSNLTALQLRGLLYAALSVANPKVTVEQAGSIIRLDTLPSVVNAIAEAYKLSMPERKPTDPPQADAPAPES